MKPVAPVMMTFMVKQCCDAAIVEDELARSKKKCGPSLEA